MATVRTCDNCNKRITDDNPVVAKLYLAPYTPGKTRATHNNYTGHMDIGLCCSSPILKGMNWRRRRPKVKGKPNGHA